MGPGKGKQVRRSNILVILEAVIIAYIAHIANWMVMQFANDAIAPKNDVLAINIALLVIFIQLSALSVGLYEAKLRESFRGILRRIFVSVALGYFVMELLTSTLLQNISMHTYYLPVASGLTILALAIFRYFSNKMGALGLGKNKIIVIGAGERAAIIEQRMRRDVDRLGFELFGFIPMPGDDRENGIKNETIVEVPIDEAFRDYLTEHDIEEIVIACDQRRGTLPIDILFDCRVRGIEIVDILDFMERESGQIAVNMIYPSWVIYSNGFHTHNYLRDALNYGINAFLAFFILLFTWPLMLGTIIAIWIEDGIGAPILYRQDRIGLNGSIFRIVKFRSMGTDAEKDGAKWASKNDNRTTKVGNVIRKYRIDELPQLMNVLRGEMGFIGPRPERPEFVEQLIREIPYYNQRHNVRPGLAGWAQLNYPYGASVEDSMEKLKFDLYYVKHQSLMLDLLILIRTVEVVLFGKGR
ncbi:TIGR03013 family XrtA/PEP-CTERM system glycosyltransferase [Neptunicella marina]|uniref:TIGR03013 family PEP-CTERM/XrtA system glycosyltransferase n=1 Tax=Neptunicella marina TaxID=2125989 RepID=A0A8J6ISU4_9ALTE|nr:TIGR03013 family XrtA/PEP-CTERM system glycosyltransferase [Neptunicella marina]MBC3765754.1 TIGR03013 family PEP-CTERM/XrtA system glycosyltransferase [Neptunicella marina]